MKEQELTVNFIPGDEWLYFKVFCGSKVADTILKDIIYPVSLKLLKSKVIDKWFYIRYNAPENHLRIRFHLTNNNFERVINTLNTKFTPLISSRLIWSISIDTYKREIERYGKNTIELAETWFYNNSILVINLLQNSSNDIERFKMSFFLINEIIKSFKLSDVDKTVFLNEMQLLFKKEFNVDTNNKRILNNKYQQLNLDKLEDINKNIFDKNAIANNQQIAHEFVRLDQKEVLLPSLKSIISSFIHMSVNRVFNIDQRMYEMMLYDFLNKTHKTKLKKNDFKVV